MHKMDFHDFGSFAGALEEANEKMRKTGLQAQETGFMAFGNDARLFAV